MTLPSSLTGSISVTRSASGGAYNNGVWVPAGTSTVTVTGLITPEKDKDIIMREGGGFADGVIKIYTNEAMYPQIKSTGQSADRITRNSRVYEVYEVTEPYSNLSVDHYRSRARRVDEKINGA